MNYAARLQALRNKLPSLECDAIVVSNLTNVRYLCGFTGSSGMIVVTRDEAHFITDFRYRSQASQQVPNEYSIVIAEKGLWSQAAILLESAETVGFEAEHISVATMEEVSELMPQVHLWATKRAVEDFRLLKDADEIAVIERAVQVIDDTFAHFLRVLDVGKSERVLALELENFMRQSGARGPSFEIIVASGARGALPHGIASEKCIERGDLVTLDMGAIVDGYCSDCTRTVCLGAPTDEQQRIYGIVWDAQVAASKALKPGLSCVEADNVAREIIRAAGHENHFGHGLGHGVGLEIHEQPRLSQLGKSDLQSGMIVTCEPGIYIEGWGGVRIEDMLVITDNGARVLTQAPKPREIIVV